MTKILNIFRIDQNTICTVFQDTDLAGLDDLTVQRIKKGKMQLVRIQLEFDDGTHIVKVDHPKILLGTGSLRELQETARDAIDEFDLMARLERLVREKKKS